MSAVTDDTERGFLSTAPVRPADRRLAFAVIAVSALIFACAAPFAGAPLPKVPAFIPSYEAALAIDDLITAVLFFEQFAKLRSSAVCALASGLSVHRIDGGGARPDVSGFVRAGRTV